MIEIANAKNIITPEEFERRMQDAYDKYSDPEFRIYDIEEVHSEMDDILMETLESLGYEDGITIFRKTPKWYA